MAEEWFAVVTDKDIFYPNDHPTMAGRLEYKKGDVVSYGSVVAPDAHLVAKGLRKISIGMRDREPDFSQHKWDSKLEQVRPKTAIELQAEVSAVGGKNG